MICVEVPVKTLRDEIEKLDKSIAFLEARLGNESFVSKAPPHLLEKSRAELQGERDKRASLDAALRAVCPKGIDVYFDNVGGEVSDAVLRNINFFGRVALCGSISQYNATTPPMGPRLLGTFVGKRVRAQGFIVTDFAGKYEPALKQMGEWIKAGKLKYREDVVNGIDKAPRAFIGLLRGENFGKMLVKLA